MQRFWQTTHQKFLALSAAAERLGHGTITLTLVATTLTGLAIAAPSAKAVEDV